MPNVLGTIIFRPFSPATIFGENSPPDSEIRSVPRGLGPRFGSLRPTSQIHDYIYIYIIYIIYI